MPETNMDNDLLKSLRKKKEKASEELQQQTEGIKLEKKYVDIVWRAYKSALNNNFYKLSKHLINTRLTFSDILRFDRVDILRDYIDTFDLKMLRAHINDLMATLASYSPNEKVYEPFVFRSMAECSDDELKNAVFVDRKLSDYVFESIFGISFYGNSQQGYAVGCVDATFFSRAIFPPPFVMSYAAKHNQVGMLKKLLDLGGNPNVTDYTKKPFVSAETCIEGGVGTPLNYAVKYGNIECVKVLLADSNTNVDSKSRDGHTALGQALAAGRYDIATLLLEAGAKINPQSGGEETPSILMSALGYDPGVVYSEPCKDPDVDFFKALVKAGADVNERCYFDLNVLLVALSRGTMKHAPIVKFLVDNGAKCFKTELYDQLDGYSSEELLEFYLGMIVWKKI